MALLHTSVVEEEVVPLIILLEEQVVTVVPVVHIHQVVELLRQSEYCCKLITSQVRVEVAVEPKLIHMVVQEDLVLLLLNTLHNT
jgi:hypothetical protein